MPRVLEARPLAERCDGCGAEVSPRLLVCPGCHRLVHARALQELAQQAGAAEASGALHEALTTWRRALDLLPEESGQARQLRARVAELSAKVPAPLAAAAEGKPGSRMPAWLAGLGGAGLLLWKLKGVLALVLGQGKVLLLGLTKVSTLLSMFLALGAYWALWGWRFALGFVLCIYVHEMGHVVALRRLGLAAGAPVFVPGLGAFVRMKQRPADAREDARVGLAGPVWGAAAVVAALGLGLATGWKVLFAIAHIAAVINVFNLLPIASLDGARGWSALSRVQRGVVTATVALAWALSHEGMLVLLLLVMGFRLLTSKDAPAQGDRTAAVTFVLLVAGLSALGTYAHGLTGIAPR